MAVAITDNRTLIDEADSLTGWSSPVAGESLTLFTSDPWPVEADASIGMAVSIETSDIVHTISSVDLSDTLVYVWALANGTMDTIANGGIALILGDGTNIVGYHLAGSDVAAFRHESGPVGWQCLILDTSNLPSAKTQLLGSVDPTITAITQVGAMYKTLSKALGGASNCFTDVMRYGNNGLLITAGTSEDTGKFSEIAVEDRASTTGQAYGIIRELGTGLYGVQGPLTFGDSVGTAATYFADTNVTVAFEDRDLGTDKYSITIQGNSTGSTTFKLGTQVGSTTYGANGCSLVVPAGVGATFTANDVDLQYLLLFGSTLSGFSGGINLSADATNGPNHKIYDCAFSLCGQIDPGKIEFKNNSISSSTDADGSLLLDADGSAAWADLAFTSDGTGHAIYITATGEYDFDYFTFDNFGADETTDAAVYNNSGGAVTINVLNGGDTPTVRNGSGASTSVVNAVTLKVKVVDEDNNPIENAQTAIYKVSDDTELMNEDTLATGIAEETYNYPGSEVDIYVRIRKSSIGTTRYVPIYTTGTITAAGYTLTAVMYEDEIIV